MLEIGKGKESKVFLEFLTRASWCMMVSFIDTGWNRFVRNSGRQSFSLDMLNLISKWRCLEDCCMLKYLLLSPFSNERSEAQRG